DDHAAPSVMRIRTEAWPASFERRCMMNVVLRRVALLLGAFLAMAAMALVGIKPLGVLPAHAAGPCPSGYSQVQRSELADRAGDFLPGIFLSQFTDGVHTIAKFERQDPKVVGINILTAHYGYYDSTGLLHVQGAFGSIAPGQSLC